MRHLFIFAKKEKCLLWVSKGTSLQMYPNKCPRYSMKIVTENAHFRAGKLESQDENLGMLVLCIHTSPIGFSDPREFGQFVEQILPWVSRASSRRAVGGPGLRQ